MKNLIKTLSFLVLPLFLLAACDIEGSEDRIKDGHARVNVFLIDAPASYDEVWIEVLGVEILTKGKEESNESAWINLPYEANDQKINLLSLTGGNSEHLGEVEIPAGEISQIRLLLGDDNYIVQNEQTIELKTPSAQQSGLKLKVDKPLAAGISYDLVIDFDASRSIVRAGNSGNYILKPVLRVVAEESATLEGTVLPLEAGPVQVSAIINQDTLGTFTDESGLFILKGLKGGEYEVLFTPNEAYETKLIEGVQLEVGQITKMEPVTLEERSEEKEEEETETENGDEG
jgi:hypothetical protein